MAMAGSHSHMYTTEEVVGMMDDVDEPICAGSDDFDDDYDGQDSDDNSGQDDEQR